MLTMWTKEKGTENIDMRQKTAKSVEAITLPLDLAFFTLEFDEVGMGLLGRWSVEPPERGRLVGEEEVEDGFRTPTPVRFIEERGGLRCRGERLKKKSWDCREGTAKAKTSDPSLEKDTTRKMSKDSI